MQAARAVPKAERTRSAILEAASQRFARSGFAATRLDDIGADVGIAGSAILYHFEGKRALYHAVLDELLEGFGRDIEQALSVSRPFVERFEGLISAVVRYVARRPEIAHIVLRDSYKNILISVALTDKSYFRAIGVPAGFVIGSRIIGDPAQFPGFGADGPHVQVSRAP